MDNSSLVQKGQDEEDPIEHLKAKAEDGIGNVIEEVISTAFKMPSVQKTLIRQSVESGLFISCLIVGILTIVNAVKQILNVSWQADIAIGVTLIIVFVVYVTKKTKK